MKTKSVIMIAAVLGLLLIGTTSAQVPAQIVGKQMSLLEVVEFLFVEHDAQRDTAYGNYQLMIYTDALTSKGFKKNTISGDYQELRIWVAKHKAYPKIVRNNNVVINN